MSAIVIFGRCGILVETSSTYTDAAGCTSIWIVEEGDSVVRLWGDFTDRVLGEPDSEVADEEVGVICNRGRCARLSIFDQGQELS